jgi:GT2 family glycosyltransferase/glycosyltransferase involved in cell wall biosynthesis
MSLELQTRSDSEVASSPLQTSEENIKSGGYADKQDSQAGIVLPPQASPGFRRWAKVQLIKTQAVLRRLFYRLRRYCASRVTEGWSLTRDILLYVIAPPLLFICALSFAIEDLCFRFGGRARLAANTAPANHAASVVIANWNGCDLLERFLPSVVAALASHPGSEIVVVDNASTDGSVSFLRSNFPDVRVLSLHHNHGFGGASNIGAQAARNDVLVMLNNDMRVEAGFLAPLLAAFADPLVFAVTSQIFFGDPAKRRQETGLTEVWWERGQIGVTHHIEAAVKRAFPCAYAGGGSSAFDRRKFLELGGFDELFTPFYYEDTDLGRLAWKRGWKVLYEPSSIVLHEHRGTISHEFSADHVKNVCDRNSLLYCWKNVHDWRMLASHFLSCFTNVLMAHPWRYAEHRARPLTVASGFLRLRQTLKSRWKALALQSVSDREAFRRPLGGYYRDRFLLDKALPPPRLNLLFVSPYPIAPPHHGGAVFMRQAILHLADLTNLHLVSLVDSEEQLRAHDEFLPICKTARFLVRPQVCLENQWALLPNAIREYEVRSFRWALHRAMFLQEIDAVQFEYTVTGQYMETYQSIPCMLFEHDVSIQSLLRAMRAKGVSWELLVECVRMWLYEPKILKRATRIQVCTRENARFVSRLQPRLKGRIDFDLRAAIDVGDYKFVPDNRIPKTLLFVGSFRHSPNVDALRWFIERVLPLIVDRSPQTILKIVGADPPQHLDAWNDNPNVELVGTVEDIKIPLQQYEVFVCPLLSGSGIRVKLLEAFASGIPVVSTRIGAEGLNSESGQLCEISDLPAAFARSVLRLQDDLVYRSQLAVRARQLVEMERNSKPASARLEQTYRAEAIRMRSLPTPVF